MNDNLFTGKEAREKLVIGVNKVADAVKGTLGYAGYNGLLEHTLSPFSVTTNDGVSIAKSIQLADPIENMGANLMKEIATKADKSSQDGTTTAMTLAQAIINGGMDIEAQPMEIKRSLEDCLPIVEEALKSQVKEIDVSEVGKVATISAEDETIGAMIQDIYTAIGRDGIIFHDASRDFKDSFTLDKGVHIQDAGFASPYMADDTPEGQLKSTAELKNPAIVITKQKINSVKDLESIGNILRASSKKDLVIFADEFESLAINDLVLTRIKGGLRTLLIKLPTLWKDWWLEDIAKLTGATVIDPALGIYLKDFKESMFGTCGSVLADKENTFLDGVLDITEHVNELMAQGTDEAHLRAARLNKKTARYHVGAPTETALAYRRYKVQDALGAAYQALHGGVVAGGGVALRECAKRMPDTIGGNLLRSALVVPAQQIAKNGGFYYFDNEFPLGLNAKTGKQVNMFDENIIDAYNTVLNSFKSAVSVSSTVLTAHVITLLPKREEAAIDPFKPYER